MTTGGLEAIRRKIPALSASTYLDSAGAGLPPTSVTDAMKSLLDDWSKTGEHWEEWLIEVIECRRLFGRSIGAEGVEIGVLPSVSVALSAVASSVDFSKRRKVVTSSLNFPTNVIVWQRMREKGILKTVEVLGHEDGVVPLQAYERAIDDGTALVAVDYVSWLSGAREDVREISRLAHDRGALLVVDSFHALGVFPFDVKRDGIDVLVSGFYKWLCGPHGVACVYIDEDQLEELKPSYMGWLGIDDNIVERLQAGRDPFDIPFSLRKARPALSASRFEWGTWAMVAVRGAIEALRFAAEYGPAYRFKTIRRLRRLLAEALGEMGVRLLTPPEESNPGAGIVTFVEKRQRAAVSRLMKTGIVTSGRFGHVRVSPHFYNSEEEVERFLGAYGQIVKGGR